MLYADVTSTIIGAVLGTSTVTTLSETAAGIAAGARTGIAFGFISYIIIHAGTGDFKKLNPTLIFIGALSVLSLIV